MATEQTDFEEPQNLDPVERFCQIIAQLDDETKEDVLFWVGMSIGMRLDRKGAVPDLDTPLGVLMQAPTIDDLYDRLTHLIDDVGLSDKFLIQSLYASVLDRFDSLAGPDNLRRTLQLHSEMLERFEAMRAVPGEHRDPEDTDERLAALLTLT